jgi:hypothetical protein
MNRRIRATMKPEVAVVDFVIPARIPNTIDKNQAKCEFTLKYLHINAIYAIVKSKARVSIKNALDQYR